jgi:hypothetical protein
MYDFGGVGSAGESYGVVWGEGLGVVVPWGGIAAMPLVIVRFWHCRCCVHVTLRPSNGRLATDE